MAIVACGYGDRRFHLVGHDWGGSIAWSLADRFPQRLASLTVLSRPHPNAFNRALQMPDGDQAQRSRHHKAFLEPDAADVVLADGARWLRERLAANGVPPARSRSISASSATRTRWKRTRLVSRARRDPRAARHDGDVPAAGATPTTPSGGSPPKAPGILSRRPIASKCCRASAISRPTRRPTVSTSCCCNTLRLRRRFEDCNGSWNFVASKMLYCSKWSRRHGRPKRSGSTHRTDASNQRTYVHPHGPPRKAARAFHRRTGVTRKRALLGPHSVLSIFQNTGVAGPPSTPVSDFRHAPARCTARAECRSPARRRGLECSAAIFFCSSGELERA